MARPGPLEADRQDRKDFDFATKIVHSRDARDQRRAARESLDHVLAAFRRVGATRRHTIRGADPTRSQRPSSRRHGATRHGQRREAFERRAALRAEAEARHRAAQSEPMAHKRMSVDPDRFVVDGVSDELRYAGRAG